MLGKGMSASCSVSEELHIGDIVTLVHKIKRQTGFQDSQCILLSI